MSKDACHDDVCVTCADQLLEVVVVGVSTDGRTALVVRDGAPEELCIELIDGVSPGDRLLAHGGVALQRAGAESAT